MSEIKTDTAFVRVPPLLNDPPSHVEGEQWRIGTGTGAWSGHNGEIATSASSAWVFAALWRISCPDFDPVGVVLMPVRATGIDTISSELSLGIGWSDGTTQLCASVHGFDAQATATDTGKRQSAAAAANMVTPGTTTVELVIDALTGSAGPVTNGWDFDLTTPSAAVHYVQVLFLGGADIGVAAAFVNNSTSFSVTGLAFQPNLCLAFGTANASTPATGTNAQMTFGVAYDNGAGTTYAAAGIHNRDNQATSISCSRIQSDCAYFSCPNDGGAGTAPFTISAWNSDGITGATGVTIDLFLLLIDTGDRAVWCDHVATRTTTGTQSYTSPGFEPQVVFGALTGISSDAPAGGTNAENSMYGFFVGGSSVSICDDDGAATSQCVSYAADDRIVLLNDDGSNTLIEIGTVAYTSSGFDWTFDKADGTARYWLAVAIEAEAGAGGDVDVNLTGSAATVSVAAGSATSAVAYSLSGSVAATALAAGTVSPALDYPVTGAAAGVGAAAGTVTPGVAMALTGEAAGISVAAGNVASAVSYALSGSSVDVEVDAGDLAAGLAYALTGSAAAAAVAAGSVTSALDRSLEGAAAGVAASAGTVALALSQALAGAGIGVSASAGSVTPSLSLALSGAMVTVELAAGTLTQSGGTPVVEEHVLADTRHTVRARISASHVIGDLSPRIVHARIDTRWIFR